MNLAKYNTVELKSVVDLDAYAVRKEAEIRAGKAARSIAKAKPVIEKAERKLAECAVAHAAACAEIAF